MLRAKKVLITTSSFGDVDRAPLEKLEASGHAYTLNPAGRRLTREEIIGLLQDGYHGLIAGVEPLDADVLRASTLEVLSRCGSGMSNVDQEVARELGIRVYNTPDGPTQSVAELTVGACLTLLRSIPGKDRAMRDGRWDKTPGRQLGSLTVAIIGYGRIGRRASALFQAFGAHVLAVDPLLEGTVQGVPVVSLREALPVADVVAVHAAGEDCLLSGPEFALMKGGAYLLNAGRGGLVDEGALMAALDEGRLAAAWLDVFTDEPYRGPLTNRPDVLLTPHIGSYTIEGRRDMELQAVENLLEGFAANA
jgi:D-3-phosphoglycerate dehydrogenase / 2-oxoglutarate reductase